MSISKLDKAQTVKILKALGYVVASAVIGWLIAFTTDNPQLFGVYAPIVNVVLVTLKQLFTEPE